ncbi:hypothetical protein BDA96_08G118300 [Sorghum bicolor]|uniref:Uncharacterized protein n=1 Tax=Sorghum bicolor TaxID=4558 RepID=A0A921QHJ2_SORBI|nr:hypothetical protein BDA96_08G118300 [Sorghum bicolor]
MFASRPVVRPLEVAAPADLAQQPPGVLMKDRPRIARTPSGLGLHVLQLLLAAISESCPPPSTSPASQPSGCRPCSEKKDAGHVQKKCGNVCCARDCSRKLQM